MENLTHQCPYCPERRALSLNSLGELFFVCRHCTSGQDPVQSPVQNPVQNPVQAQPPAPDENPTDNYDAQYDCFEAVQNLLCDWLDDMEDQGYLSASEHDFMEASIYDAQPY